MQHGSCTGWNLTRKPKAYVQHRLQILQRKFKPGCFFVHDRVEPWISNNPDEFARCKLSVKQEDRCVITQDIVELHTSSDVLNADGIVVTPDEALQSVAFTVVDTGLLFDSLGSLVQYYALAPRPSFVCQLRLADHLSLLKQNNPELTVEDSALFRISPTGTTVRAESIRRDNPLFQLDEGNGRVSVDVAIIDDNRGSDAVGVGVGDGDDDDDDGFIHDMDLLTSMLSRSNRSSLETTDHASKRTSSINDMRVCPGAILEEDNLEESILEEDILEEDILEGIAPPVQTFQEFVAEAVVIKRASTLVLTGPGADSTFSVADQTWDEEDERDTLNHMNHMNHMVTSPELYMSSNAMSPQSPCSITSSQYSTLQHVTNTSTNTPPTRKSSDEYSTLQHVTNKNTYANSMYMSVSAVLANKSLYADIAEQPAPSPSPSPSPSPAPAPAPASNGRRKRIVHFFNRKRSSDVSFQQPTTKQNRIKARRPTAFPHEDKCTIPNKLGFRQSDTRFLPAPPPPPPINHTTHPTTLDDDDDDDFAYHTPHQNDVQDFYTVMMSPPNKENMSQQEGEYCRLEVVTPDGADSNNRRQCSSISGNRHLDYASIHTSRPKQTIYTSDANANSPRGKSPRSSALGVSNTANTTAVYAIVNKPNKRLSNNTSNNMYDNPHLSKALKILGVTAAELKMNARDKKKG